MRCKFVFKAYERSCGGDAVEGLWHELPSGDFLEAELCAPHAQAYGAIMAADRERHRVVPEPPATADDAPEPDEP